MKEQKIDFVIAWVDGNDRLWREEKQKYSPQSGSDSREIRYRDWENLKYWFRGIEKYASWVNKIYFVTCGHLPEWLNTKHPKLVITNHKDFIPNKYLPTFSANPIELNIHRIPNLSEQFVFFNDDTFITKQTKPEDFFKNGLPCDSAVLNPHISQREYKTHMEAADMDVINDNFNKNQCIKSNFLKWFNYKYGKNLLKTICLLPWEKFTGFTQWHIANSYLKSVYEEIWEKEYETLNETCLRKFRYILDVNQWLIENWQLASGKFYPRNPKIGKSYVFTENKEENKKILKDLEKQNYKIMSINDMVKETDTFEKWKLELIKSFDKILPEKSKFEK